MAAESVGRITRPLEAMHMKSSPKVSFFSQNQMEIIKSRVFELLDQKGVKMDHPEVLDLLGKAGAKVDFDTKMVRFPKPFLEKQIGKTPQAVTLSGRDGRNNLQIPRDDGTFFTRTNTGAQSWIDPKIGEYRKITSADIKTWATLADRLDHIDFSAYPVASDVPPATADVHALSLMLPNTNKHIWVQPYTGESIEYLIKLSIAASGGEAALKKASPVSFITCALTPMEFKYMDLEIISKCTRAAIPLHACSLPGAGSTAPATMPGVVLLATAEIMAMVATSQVFRSGSPVIATPLIFSTDMRTGKSLQSSAEAIQGAALAVQFIKAAFGIPTHTYGIGSDSPHIDGQCMSEGALRSMLIGLSGTDILGAAGQIETATTISPVQLTIDNEVFGIVKRIIRKMTIDDETMAWQELLNTSPGSQFFTSDHTLRHCRDGAVPVNFVQMARDLWETEGQNDLVARVTESCKSSLAKPSAPTLSEDTIKEIDSIVALADTQLI